MQERARIIGWNQEIAELLIDANTALTRCRTLVATINENGRRAGLPSFEVDFQGNCFIFAPGKIGEVIIKGQHALDSGLVIRYGEITVMLDHSETVKSTPSSGQMARQPPPTRMFM
jgi:hypothetical protein